MIFASHDAAWRACLLCGEFKIFDRTSAGKWQAACLRSLNLISAIDLAWGVL
jgi:hypothetical protein